MRGPLQFLLALGFALQAQQPVPSLEAFTKEVEQLDARLAKAKELGAKLNEEGRVEEGTRVLLEAVPKGQRTAAFDFLVGNLLFDLDPPAAYRLHQQAYAKAPLLKPVAFEWGLEEHRAGHYAEAAAIYEGALEPNEDFRRALLADCYLRIGETKKACQAWREARHPRFHAQIEEAIHWVYGKPSPYRRRAESLARAAQGGQPAWESVLELDVKWDTDWWNGGTQEALLQADLSRAHAALGEGPAWSELQAFAKVVRMHGPSAEEIREVLKIGPWILDGHPLPQSTRLASRLLERLQEKDLLKPAAWMTRFRDELWTRARRGQPGDEEALHILASGALSQDLPIEDIDRFGWERYQDGRFALSFLLGRGKALRSTDPDLVKALSQFPKSAPIARLAAACAFQEKASTKEALVRLIEAEYTGLESDGSHSSYALKAYWAALEDAK